MADQAHNEPTYHVLLIGVDDYPHAALGGCVNDIDEVQRLLLGERMAKHRDRVRIRRLASPLPGTEHETSVPAVAATLANIRDALDQLASDEVRGRDRVFIYYSGHGSRVEVTAPDGRRLHREALVPVDYDAEPSGRRMLFDYELNDRLRAITAKTPSVTVVLDCCHAAGATRDSPDREHKPRFLDLSAILGRHVDPLPDPASQRPAVNARTGERSVPEEHRLGGGVDLCHVVCACLNHEIAKEDTGDGIRHGLLTRALIATLKDADNVELPAVTWGRIWQKLQAYVEARNPWQHPWMAGNLGRAVLAGPPVEGDPGIAVSHTPEGFRIEAGTLASITEEAVLAVYGPKPAYFPPLHDDTHRIGMLRVTRAERAWSLAEAIGTLELVDGARARLIKPGPGSRLRCGVVPSNAAIEAQIEASNLLELVQPGDGAAVRLEQCGRVWRLTDDVHGTSPEAPVLFALEPHELSFAGALLEHYRGYSLPLRVAERATDLPDALKLRVLACPDKDLSSAEAQVAVLPDAASSGAGSYALRSGAKVGFSVHNLSPHTLKVALFNVAASGKVQLIDDQEIDAGAVYTFWARNNLGSPFKMVPPAGVAHCIDHMVAIGRTAMSSDLKYLNVGKTFAQVVQRTRGDGSRDLDDGTDKTAALEHWTSAHVIIETDDRPRP
jgi:hypothetical protein